MDEKGYAFTPLVFLLFIPIMILAVSYGNIVEEINAISTIALGGDVTHDTAVNIYTSIEKGTSDAGRNGAYNATRKVIDERKFLTNSTSYIRNVTIINLNAHVTSTCMQLENETGREIYINNIPITNYTRSTFSASDVTISQEDPFGFYVDVKAGIPIKVVQRDQVYEGATPKIRVYVPIDRLEDPYIWINSKERTSNVIYKYPYQTYTPVFGLEYHFADVVEQGKLHYLWECLNGTDDADPGKITPRPYYFQDIHGLSFFDRLENKTPGTSTSLINTRMSTFILGDPLYEEHGRESVSRIDNEYFANIGGGTIETKHGSIITAIRDPEGSIFYLSPPYKTYLGLAGSPYNY
ncbi:MAG: hypothetical protein HZC47_07640 [Methanobacterium sp.]|uniref:hypothetical protein n=1 Tax=Methanobacterium sp. TaxID=2164 RepID=UPI003D6522B3|nr:hypothetical protein [Methanobacterium sp.]